MAQRKLHYVLSTHWDREWYQSFQHYRWRLVRLMDQILDGLEDGRLKGPFQTDGQSIILDDYLEIHPERREQVERFAREGKLKIGPWYVLPDEYLVSGESHIRNIRMGREIARDYGGEPSHAGFACDLFGHISQLPQIFAGFGINNALVWRGINLHEVRNLIWKGADGTEAVCYKFDLVGYCDYAFNVRDANKPEECFEHDDAAKKLDKYLDFESSQTEIDPVLIFDGGDHQEWDQDIYSVLMEKAEKKGGKYKIVHSTLDDYVDEMIADRKKIKARREGELREPGKIMGKAGHQIHGVLSSRVWIKQQNAHCENVLCRWAEPFASFAHHALGEKYPEGFLQVAWRWLIRNHPHDSICGCSIDQVHEDMKFRFSQSRQISEMLTVESTRRIAASIKGDVKDDEIRVVLFNSTQSDYDGTTEVDLELPTDYPKFGEFFWFEDKPVFKILGHDGKEIPYQRVAQDMGRSLWRIHYVKFPHNMKVNKVRVSLPVSIPAMGYTMLTIQPAKDHHPYRHPVSPGLAVSERAMENEFLRVQIEGNGTLTITDRKSGEVYTDVLTFEDCADIGDGWFHGQAVNDQKYVSTACPADVALLENGKYVTSFRIRNKVTLPSEFDFKKMVRSEERAELIIDSIIRLRPGQAHLEVETTVHNNIKDHRLRVLMPSDAQAKTYIADSPFDVVERNIALIPNNHEYMELDVETKPQQTFTAVSDKKRGMAAITTGLYESAVQDNERRTLALTLYRSTRRTVGTDGEPEGQLIGDLHFRYFIKPFKGEADRTELYELGQKIATGFSAVQQRTKDIELQRVNDSLPPRASFLSVSGGAVMTSSRRTDVGFEVRLFNPHGKKIQAKLSWKGAPKNSSKYKKAARVDFESNAQKGALKIENSGLSIALKPKEIATICLS